METIKKFKSSIILLLMITVTLGFMYKQNTGLRVGEIAPELKFNNPEGKEISLSSLKGKVVLIDFWSSWCVPCRRENPTIVKAYNMFKDKKFKNGDGFTVYGYSLDTNKEAWKAAIEKDGLIWKSHTSDLKGWDSEGAAIYNVSSIPSNYLIDGNGKIIATNLKGEALIEALSKFEKK
ncbi:MAG: TlpA disulfide reductase family protein [Vicingaceae bacterium]|nr:TlpA disulfide reductase family protein [Vicingaceae bacterium]